jgi:DNA-3-methyladenine glycosylase II
MRLHGVIENVQDFMNASWGNGMRKVLCRDPVMRRVMAAVGGLRTYYRERTDFETVCRIITGQQLSYAAALSIWKRVRDLEESWQPKHVARLKPAQLLECGLSRSKAVFIQEAAKRAARHDLDFVAIRKMPDERAHEALLSIKGFGPWSVEMFMIFALDRPDVFSVGDAGLRRAVCSLYDIPKGRYEARALKVADNWRPYRSFACRYLWGWLDTDDARRGPQ